MFAVLKKEFKSYLLTPLGYIFIGIFLIMFSLFFYIDIYNYQAINFEYLFYNGATILTFVVPVLTMRMFSEERKSGTEQLILTSPRSLTSIVLGKFLAAVLIIAITEVFTFIYFGILNYFGDPSLKVAFSTLAGFLLLGAAYISFGMFASSITESQIVAFILSVGVFISMWFLPNIDEIFTPFCLVSKFDSFPRGIISISEVITFATFILLFISLTIVVLQSRKTAHR